MQITLNVVIKKKQILKKRSTEIIDIRKIGDNHQLLHVLQ